MEELVETLLPNLPDKLIWVKGIFYCMEGIAFFGMLLSPMLIITGTIRKRRRY